MDNLNLPSSLILMWDLKRAIEKNISLKNGIQNFVQRPTKLRNNDAFRTQFLIWWSKFEKEKVSDLEPFNAQHRAIIMLIELGLRGISIYEQLKALEADIVEICESDIQEHAAKLPLLLQIPLVFLIFPAICILLLVPTLSQRQL
jgi:hypothetical protein